MEDAVSFLARANARLLDLNVRANRAAWVQATYITDDTEEISAEHERARIAGTMELAAEALRFDSIPLPAEPARQLEMIKRSVVYPAPADHEAQVELTRTMAALEGMFGKGRYQDKGLDVLDRVLAESRDPEERLDAWRGWRTIAPPMREPFARFVALANEGARDLGYADLGTYWRSGYDMPPDAFAAEMERLWVQVRPLYDSLLGAARAALERAYGAVAVRPDGRIPAHLLGNMWSQEWSGLYPLVADPSWSGGLDLTAALRARTVTPVEMVRYGERFYTSLGFDPLPATFWERSQFSKPADREVVCHPSAWSIDADEDVRLKMCIEPTAVDFNTIHHELGHSIYERAYRRLPFLFREGANAGFHEAIGDAISLSITPRYLADLGLIDHEPGADADLPALLRTALERVPLLPFAMAVDTWRWRVFAGAITPEDYNASWWDLVSTYQRVAPPVDRTEADFDVASKYHVASNIPYAPYFVAFILQFQFHRALARQAGHVGPLHRYTMHGDTGAGARLARMLEMGRSRPWPDALEALTGEREMDATAVLEYFAPLQAWLDTPTGRGAGS